MSEFAACSQPAGAPAAAPEGRDGALHRPMRVTLGVLCVHDMSLGPHLASRSCHATLFVVNWGPDPCQQAYALFMEVWGVGPRTAEKWIREGCTTLEDAGRRHDLSDQQRVGAGAGAGWVMFPGCAAVAGGERANAPRFSPPLSRVPPLRCPALAASSCCRPSCPNAAPGVFRVNRFFCPLFPVQFLAQPLFFS